MKLHEMKQKRNIIAKDMRALHDKIGDTPWTDEQRTQWNAAKSELDALDERIAREEELRRQDQDYIHENEPEQRQQQNRDPANPEAQANERRAAAFNAFLRRGLGEMSAEERQALKELRAQGTTPDEKGGYTVPTQFRNKIVEALKDYGGIASVAQILNTANGQTPFVTFGFGLGTSWESRLIQQSILRNRIAGLGKNRKTAVFPKLVFAIRDGLNHKFGDPNYDIKQLALECASKRMYPDILNYDQVVKVTGSFKTPMGCRSFLGVWENENGEQVHDGRNNLGVISLNLPRIALEAKGDEAAFWALLDERLQLARKALMTRIARLEGVKARVAPILYMEGACGVRLKADDDVSEIFKNGRASISLGYIGIHETINALYGNQHMYDSEALREKGVAIVQRLRDAVDLWKEETGYGFSLYSTPSENLCDRFCRLDTAEFGVVEGVTDKGYYTNSFHLDVEKKVNPYDKIDFEAPYPPLANGGFICYGEYPNIQHNLKALEDVWDYSYQHVPYYGTNTPIDECYECGFTGEFECTSKGFTCPKCGNHDAARVSVTRRVCGYLGSPDARPFNAGKQEEVKRRVKHLGNGQIG